MGKVKRMKTTGRYSPRFSFRHISDTVYHILEYDRPHLVVRAYGKALVVDKHQTAMMTKQTTSIDRFDFYEEAEGHVNLWIWKAGPEEQMVMNALSSVLTKIVEHHENYLAKLIVE